jgi:hypothetical protein
MNGQSLPMCPDIGSVYSIIVWNAKAELYNLGYLLLEEEGECRTACPPGMYPHEVIS